MAEGDLERIFRALEEARVRYLVVGGVAVVLHGHPRFTADLDLVVQLDPANVGAALKALTELGYRPRLPVNMQDFADPAKRQAWVKEKGLRVFSLWNPERPVTEVDLFVEEPFPFEEVHGRGTSARIGGTVVTVVALDDLISLKRAAGRPQDSVDLAALDAIRRIRKESADG